MEVFLLSLLSGGSVEVSLLHKDVLHSGNDKPWHNLVPSPVTPHPPRTAPARFRFAPSFPSIGSGSPSPVQAAPPLWFRAHRLFWGG